MNHKWIKIYSNQNSNKRPGEKVFLNHQCKICNVAIGSWEGFYPEEYKSIPDQPPQKVLDRLNIKECRELTFKEKAVEKLNSLSKKLFNR